MAATASPPTYPQGGSSSGHGGQGIFVDPTTGEAIRIWVDTAIQSRFDLIKSLIVSDADPAVCPPLFLTHFLARLQLICVVGGRCGNRG